MNTLLLLCSLFGTLAAILLVCSPGPIPAVVSQSIPVLLLTAVFAGYRLWYRNLE